jgi:lysophospholipase L1-like esterase
MPTKYERIFADDPNSHYDFAWQPDVVAVNLGTNDYSGGDPGQNYLDDFTAFAKQIRGHYPKALILLAVGSMLGQEQHDQVIGYFKTIIANRKTDGDTNLDWVDLGIQDGTNDGYGCDYHPTTATDQKMADKFVAKLHDKMGW